MGQRILDRECVRWRFPSLSKFLTSSPTKMEFSIPYREECVVYFHQHLGVQHPRAAPKCWPKFSFLAFFVLKTEKKQKSNKFFAKFSKKGFLSVHQNAGRRFYSQNIDFYDKKCWKLRFRPVFGVCSTQTLVKIYNRNVQSPNYFLCDTLCIYISYL